MKKEILSFKTLLLILGFALFTLSSCEDDNDDITPDDPLPANVVEVITGSDNHNTLAAAVSAAGLVQTLQGSGPFTVFAPTDAAFAALPGGTVESLLDDPEGELTDILLYHVLGNKVMSGSLSNGMNVSTLFGEDLAITITNGNVFINGAQVTVADIETQNGVVHVIDAVLLPGGEETPATIVEIASSENDFMTLVAALGIFPELVAALDGEGDFTVFAPTNEAFAALLDAIGQTELNDIPESVVRDILEYHVITTAVFSGDLTSGDVPTFGGESISVDISDGVVLNGSVNVSRADIEASNGVVHVIDGVLVPPSIAPVVGTIVAPAYFNKDFSTLVAAVLEADEDILSVLLGDGPFTLFAPTNEAFEAAGITALPDGATLSAVLKYHLVNGEIKAADLPTGSASVETFGDNFYLSNNGAEGVFINGTTEVVATDIQGSNGVVHIIDKTLLPPSQSIAEIVTDMASGGDPEFTQLLSAVARTDGEDPDLLAAVSGDGDLTVFAPTDAAFADLYSALGVDGIDDIDLETLTAVLTHHVVGSRVFSTDLTSGPVATLNGDVTIDTSELTVTDGQGNVAELAVSLLNIHATNGVIHVIDKVLLP